MFQKLVAIEPVSLVLSAEKALYSFADEVVMYSDIPAGDNVKLYITNKPVYFREMSECPVYRYVLFTILSRKCECGYPLC